MREANKNHVDCKCVSCVCYGRYDGNDTDSDRWTCLFKQWFENQIASCDMEVLPGATNQLCVQHDSSPDWVVDLEAHFVSNAQAHLTSRAGEDWDCFTYGAKLWKATSADDPELMKLKKLFEILA